MIREPSSALEDPRVAAGFSDLRTRLAERLRAGDRRVGWKIGLNAPAMQARLGIRGPVLGVLTSGTFCADETLRASPGGILLIEAELALRLCGDLAGGVGEADAAQHIEAVAPALELLAIDGPLDDVQSLVARNTYHASFAIGEWTAPEQALASELKLELQLDATAPVSLQSDLIVGSPAQIVAFASRFLHARGERLHAGDVLLCGSLNAALRVRPGQRIRAALAPLGSLCRRIVES